MRRMMTRHQGFRAMNGIDSVVVFVALFRGLVRLHQNAVIMAPKVGFSLLDSW